jgi:hypothetical protein
MNILLLMIFSVLVFISNSAAASCEGVADDDKRLACYDSAQSCISLDDAVARLACFDAIFGKSSTPVTSSTSATERQPAKMPERATDHKMPADRSAGSSPTPSSQQAAPQSQVPIVDESSTGSLEESQKTDKAIADDLKFPLPSPPPKEEDRVSITATITAIKKAPYDLHYLTLDNNQVWKETRKSRVRFKVGQRVTIKEGILGTQDLYVQGKDRATKVKRIK